jgi:hypothetical protein
MSLHVPNMHLMLSGCTARLKALCLEQTEFSGVGPVALMDMIPYHNSGLGAIGHGIHGLVAGKDVTG